MNWKQQRDALDAAFGCTKVRWDDPKRFTAEAPHISYSDKHSVFHDAMGHGKTGEEAVTDLFNRLVKASESGRRIIMRNPALPPRDYAWTGKGFAIASDFP